MLLCVFLIACSNDIKVIEEPDYYTKTEDIKRNYEGNKGKEEINNDTEKENNQNADQSNNSAGNERRETILKGQDVHFTDDMYIAISQQAFRGFVVVEVLEKKK
jgi:hypothetical protein